MPLLILLQRQKAMTWLGFVDSQWALTRRSREPTTERLSRKIIFDNIFI